MGDLNNKEIKFTVQIDTGNIHKEFQKIQNDSKNLKEFLAKSSNISDFDKVTAHINELGEAIKSMRHELDAKSETEAFKEVATTVSQVTEQISVLQKEMKTISNELNVNTSLKIDTSETQTALNNMLSSLGNLAGAFDQVAISAGSTTKTMSSVLADTINKTVEAEARLQQYRKLQEQINNPPKMKAGTREGYIQLGDTVVNTFKRMNDAEEAFANAHTARNKQRFNDTRFDFVKAWQEFSAVRTKRNDITPLSELIGIDEKTINNVYSNIVTKTAGNIKSVERQLAQSKEALASVSTGLFQLKDGVVNIPVQITPQSELQSQLEATIKSLQTLAEAKTIGVPIAIGNSFKKSDLKHLDIDAENIKNNPAIKKLKDAISNVSDETQRQTLTEALDGNLQSMLSSQVKWKIDVTMAEIDAQMKKVREKLAQQMGNEFFKDSNGEKTRGMGAIARIPVTLDAPSKENLDQISAKIKEALKTVTSSEGLNKSLEDLIVAMDKLIDNSALEKWGASFNEICQTATNNVKQTTESITQLFTQWENSSKHTAENLGNGFKAIGAEELVSTFKLIGESVSEMNTIIKGIHESGFGMDTESMKQSLNTLLKLKEQASQSNAEKVNEDTALSKLVEELKQATAQSNTSIESHIKEFVEGLSALTLALKVATSDFRQVAVSQERIDRNQQLELARLKAQSQYRDQKLNEPYSSVAKADTLRRANGQMDMLRSKYMSDDSDFNLSKKYRANVAGEKRSTFGQAYKELEQFIKECSDADNKMTAQIERNIFARIKSFQDEANSKTAILRQHSNADKASQQAKQKELDAFVAESRKSLKDIKKEPVFKDVLKDSNSELAKSVTETENYLNKLASGETKFTDFSRTAMKNRIQASAECAEKTKVYLKQEEEAQAEADAIANKKAVANDAYNSSEKDVKELRNRFDVLHDSGKSDNGFYSEFTTLKGVIEQIESELGKLQSIANGTENVSKTSLDEITNSAKNLKSSISDANKAMNAIANSKYSDFAHEVESIKNSFQSGETRRITNGQLTGVFTENSKMAEKAKKAIADLEAQLIEYADALDKVANHRGNWQDAEHTKTALEAKMKATVNAFQSGDFADVKVNKNHGTATIIPELANKSISTVTEDNVRVMSEYLRGLQGAQAETLKLNSQNNTATITIKRFGEASKQVVMSYQGGWRIAEKSTQGARTALEKINALLSHSIKFMAQYFSGYMLVMQGRAILSKGINTLKELDTAMVEVQKVSDETTEHYAKFRQEIAQTAKEVASTNKDLLTSSASWMRLGYSIDQASKLARTSQIFVNVGDGVDIQTATSDLITALKAFPEQRKAVTEQAQHIVDVYNNIGNKYAVDATGIGDIVQRSGSALASGGASLDDVVALGTSMNEILQNSEKTGQALKTLAMRIRSSKVDMKSAGEETDGMATSLSKSRDKILALSGVDIMKNANEYKSFVQIVKELGAVFDDLSDVNKAALLEILAGKNQSNSMSALLKNYKQIDNVLLDIRNSTGSAEKENRRIVDSIQGRMNTLSASSEEFWQKFIDTNAIKYGVSGLNELLQILTKLVGTVGAIPLGTGLFAFLSTLRGNGSYNTAVTADAQQQLQNYAQQIKQYGNRKNPVRSAYDDFRYSQNIWSNKEEKEAQLLAESGLSGELFFGMRNKYSAKQLGESRNWLNRYQNKNGLSGDTKLSDLDLDNLKIDEKLVKPLKDLKNSGAVTTIADADKAMGNLGASAIKSSSGIKFLSTALNVAKSALLSFALMTAVQGMYSLVTATSDLANRAKDFSTSLEQSSEKIRKIKSDLEQYRDTISSSSASFDDKQSARQSLEDLKSQMIETYGTGAEQLNLINQLTDTSTNKIKDQTGAIIEQKDAWNQLNEQAYRKQVDEENAKGNWWTKVKNWFATNGTETNNVNSELYAYKNATAQFRTDNAEIQKMLQATGFNVSSDEDGKLFTIKGTATEVESILQQVDDSMHNLSVTDKAFTDDLSSQLGKIRTEAEDTQALFTQTVLYSDDAKKKMSQTIEGAKTYKDAFQAIANLDNQYKIEVDDDKRAELKAQISSDIESAIKIATDAGEADIVRMFKSAFTEYQPDIHVQQLKKAIAPNHKPQAKVDASEIDNFTKDFFSLGRNDAQNTYVIRFKEFYAGIANKALYEIPQLPEYKELQKIINDSLAPQDGESKADYIARVNKNAGTILKQAKQIQLDTNLKETDRDKLKSYGIDSKLTDNDIFTMQSMDAERLKDASEYTEKQKESYSNLVVMAGRYGVTLEQLISLMREENLIGNQTRDNLIERYNGANQKANKEIDDWIKGLNQEQLEILATLGIDDKASKEELQKALDKAQNQANGNPIELNTTSDHLDTLTDGVADFFDNLAKVQADIKNGGSLDWTQLASNKGLGKAINEASKEIPELKDVWDDFMKEVSKSPDKINDSIKKTTNKMVDLILREKGGLENLNEESKDAVIGQLSNYGITNAKEYVEGLIEAQNEAKESAQGIINAVNGQIEANDRLTDSNGNVSASTIDKIASMANEQNASVQTRIELFTLAQQMITTAMTTMDLSQQINAIQQLGIMASSVAGQIAGLAGMGGSYTVLSKKLANLRKHGWSEERIQEVANKQIARIQKANTEKMQKAFSESSSNSKTTPKYSLPSDLEKKGKGGGGGKGKKEKEVDDLAKISKELDELQKGYQSLTSIVDAYNQTGRLTIDQAQELINTDFQTLALLTDENGQIQLNEKGYRKLVDAKLNDMKVQMALNALKAVEGLTSEAEAVKYLANTYKKLKETSLDAVMGQVETAVEGAKAKGGKIAEAAEQILTSLKSAVEMSENIDYTDNGKANNVLSTLSSQLDEIQSAYKDMTAIQESYNKEHKISIDQAQQLVNSDFRYLALLNVQDGKLDVSKKGFQELAKAKMQEMKIQLALNAIDTINNLTDEAKAVEYLKNAYHGLTGETLDAVEAQLKLAVANAKARGAKQGEAAELVEKGVTNAFKLIDKTDYSANSLKGEDSSQKEAKVIDLIERVTGRVEKVVQKWQKAVDRMYTFWDKNWAINKALQAISKERSTKSETMEYYQGRMRKLKVPKKYRKLLEEGKVGEITTYNDKLAEKIEKYQDWQKKVDDLRDSLEDLYDTERDLIKQKLQSILDYFGEIQKYYDSVASLLDSEISLKNAFGQRTNAYDYFKQFANAMQEYDNAVAKQKAYIEGQNASYNGNSANSDRRTEEEITREVRYSQTYKDIEQKIRKLKLKDKLSDANREKLAMYKAEQEAMLKNTTLGDAKQFSTIFEKWYKLELKKDKKGLSKKEEKLYESLGNKLSEFKESRSQAINGASSEMNEMINEYMKAGKTRGWAEQATQINETFDREKQAKQDAYKGSEVYREALKNSNKKGKTKEQADLLLDWLKRAGNSSNSETIAKLVKDLGKKKTHDSALAQLQELERLKQAELAEIEKRRQNELEKAEKEYETQKNNNKEAANKALANAFEVVKKLLMTDIEYAKMQLETLKAQVAYSKTLLTLYNNMDDNVLKGYAPELIDHDSYNYSRTIADAKDQIPAINKAIEGYQKLIETANGTNSDKELWGKLLDDMLVKYKDNENFSATLTRMKELLNTNDWNENTLVAEWQQGLAQLQSEMVSTVQDIQALKDEAREKVKFKTVNEIIEKATSAQEALEALAVVINDDRFKNGNFVGSDIYGKNLAEVYTNQVKSRIQTVNALRQKLEDAQKIKVDANDEYGYASQKAKDEDIAKFTAELYKAEAEVDNIKKAFRENVTFKAITDAIKQTDSLIGKLSSMTTLIDDDYTHDKNGVTEFGLAKANILGKQLTEQMRKAKEQQELISKIKTANSNDTVMDDYASAEEQQEALNKAIEDYGTYAENAKSVTKQLYELAKQEEQKEVERLNKMIDKRKELLNAKKSYYDYDKNVRGQVKDIQNLQAQIKALEGINTTEAKAKLATLNAELNDKQEALADTQKEHEFDIITNALDELSKKLSEDLDKTDETIYESFENYYKKIKDLLSSANGVDANKSLNKIIGMLSEISGVDLSAINFNYKAPDDKQKQSDNKSDGSKNGSQNGSNGSKKPNSSEPSVSAVDIQKALLGDDKTVADAVKNGVIVPLRDMTTNLKSAIGETFAPYLTDDVVNMFKSGLTTQQQGADMLNEVKGIKTDVHKLTEYVVHQTYNNVPSRDGIVKRNDLNSKLYKELRNAGIRKVLH